mgnify:FL=1
MLLLYMDYDMKPYHQLIEENEKLESMIHIYEKEIDDQQDEIARLKKEVDFLIQQLEYKTLGKPTED